MADASSEARSMKIGRLILLTTALAAVLAIADSTVALGSTLPEAISENTTLTKAGSPYSGTTKIESGVVVTVEPGVEFTSGSISVSGTFDVEGTSKDPVVFRPASPGGNYGRLTFKPGSGGSVVDHAELVHAGVHSYDQAILIEESSPTITHTTIRESPGDGIDIRHGGAPNIGYDTIDGGAIGVAYYEPGGHSGAVDVHDNTVKHTYGSAAIFVSIESPIEAISLGGNVLIENESTEAIYYRGELAPDIASNPVTSNKNDFADIAGTLSKSATWSDPGGPIGGGGITVANGATLTVEPGMTFRGAGFTVKGTLKVDGSSEEPVVFKRGSSNFGGLTFKPGSGASVIDHAELIEAGYAYEQAVMIEGSSPTITHTTIKNSLGYGINVVHGGAPDIGFNTINGSGSNGISYTGYSEDSGTVDIHDNTVEHCHGSAAIFAYIESPVKASSLGDNTLIENESTEPLYYRGELPPDITDNSVVGKKPPTVNEILDISGTLSQPAHWSNPNTPIGGGAITVTSGVTLTVEPGVTFRGAGFTVNGTLKVDGSPEEPVVFERRGVSNFGGLKFKPGSGASVVDYAEVLEAGSSSEQAILVEGSSPTITHTTIRNSPGYGIYVKDGGAPDIGFDTINGGGSSGIIYIGYSEDSGAVNVHDNTIEHTYGSAAIFVSIESPIEAISLGGNVLIENESTEAIYYRGELAPDVANNDLAANKGNYIDIAGTLNQSATWSDPGAPIGGGAITVASGVTLRIDPGVIFQGAGLTVNGTLKAEGSSEEPVVFERRSVGNFGGLKFKSSSGASVVDHAELIGAGYASEQAILVEGSSPTITHTTIRESPGYAIKATGGSPEIEWDAFRGNAYGLLWSGEGTLNAPHNDWGCPGGPAPTGCGEEVSGKVEWKPAAEIATPKRPCAGTAYATSGPDCLLYVFAPYLKLDDQESYRPDAAGEITDYWRGEGGLWKRGLSGERSNQLLDAEAPVEFVAASDPRRAGGSGEFVLSLGALGSTYPNSRAADESDWLDEDNEDYAESAYELEKAGYENRSYGRVVKLESGGYALQYWYWYYYNGFEVAGIGAHEGDWEMVQVDVNPQLEPTEIFLSEHTGMAKCEPDELESSEAGAPVVYVAAESHANYARPGWWAVPAPVGLDRADGEGATVRPTVQDVTKREPRWLDWEGHWGNSRGGGLDQKSPQGPKFHHPEWEDPEGLEGTLCLAKFEGDEGEGAAIAGPAPRLGAIEVEGKHPMVEISVPEAALRSRPELIVSVDEPGDGLHPQTHVVQVAKARSVAVLPVRVNRSRPFSILASLRYPDGSLSEVVTKKYSP
jgi:hypothetical protein